uniref:Uncharacterized protein n=1 Tax=Arundo donax TaxID=35708 RepID=A0A0A9H6F9_ARUDO
MEARMPKFGDNSTYRVPHHMFCLQLSKCSLFLFTSVDIAAVIIIDVEEVEAAVAQAECVHCRLVLIPGEGPVLAW